jgi:hypothetical protein
MSADDADDVLRDEFPWIDALPPADRGRFVADFVRSVEASAELGRWAVLGQTIIEWKATAAVHADPALRAELSGDLDIDFGPVPGP